jgi:hypothetical protein
METKRTEWKYTKEPYSGSLIILESNNCIAEVTTEADAKLITAAPDLLEALDSLLKVTATYPINEENLYEAKENARKAIKKAT